MRSLEKSNNANMSLQCFLEVYFHWFANWICYGAVHIRLTRLCIKHATQNIAQKEEVIRDERTIVKLHLIIYLLVNIIQSN